MAFKGSVHDVGASRRKSRPGIPISSRPNPAPPPLDVEGAEVIVASQSILITAYDILLIFGRGQPFEGVEGTVLQ